MHHAHTCVLQVSVSSLENRKAGCIVAGGGGGGGVALFSSPSLGRPVAFACFHFDKMGVATAALACHHSEIGELVVLSRVGEGGVGGEGWHHLFFVTESAHTCGIRVLSLGKDGRRRCCISVSSLRNWELVVLSRVGEGGGGGGGYHPLFITESARTCGIRVL